MIRAFNNKFKTLRDATNYYNINNVELIMYLSKTKASKSTAIELLSKNLAKSYITQDIEYISYSGYCMTSKELNKIMIRVKLGDTSGTTMSKNNIIKWKVINT